MFQEIPFGGLHALEADELVGIEEAIHATDCILDDATIRPREGYRRVSASALGSAGDAVQGLWRFRPSANSARTVAVLGGKIYTLSDPSSEDTSDGTATLSAQISGWETAAISAAVWGEHLYIASDVAGSAWRRMDSSYNLQTLTALARGDKPSATLSTLSVVRYADGTVSLSTSGGAVTTSFQTDWYRVDGGGSASCPVGGEVVVDLGSATNLLGYNWIALLVTPPTASQGGGVVEIAVATATGAYETIGSTHDGPGWGSPTVLYAPLVGLTTATRQAVRRIRFRLTRSAGKWAVYGHMFVPTAPQTGTIKYRVTFFQSSTQQRSDPTEEIEVSIRRSDITIPTIHSLYADRDGFTDGGQLSLDPTTIPLARFANRQNGESYPARDDFAGVPTITGSIPSGSQYPSSDLVELWRLTVTGWRRAKTQTLTGGETTYSLVDDQGDVVLGNEIYRAGGSPPRCTALAARASRLIAGHENRVYISGYIAPSVTSTPYPQFPSIALEESDGWAFDISPGKTEQIQAIVNGNGLYILTNESCYVMSDLSPGSVPERVFDRGVNGRRGALFAENILIWASWDGIYTARNRSEITELTQSIRRLYIDWFQPDSTVVLGYKNRVLYAECNQRGLRYDFVTDTWTQHTRPDVFQHSVFWRDPTGKPQLWFFTQTRFVQRIQSTATTDDGVARPAWEYQTGYAFMPTRGRVRQIMLQVDKGPVSVELLSGTTAASRTRSFSTGLHALPMPADWTSYQFRIRLIGHGGARVSRLLWERQEVAGEGG